MSKMPERLFVEEVPNSDVVYKLEYVSKFEKQTKTQIVETPIPKDGE